MASNKVLSPNNEMLNLRRKAKSAWGVLDLGRRISAVYVLKKIQNLKNYRWCPSVLIKPNVSLYKCSFFPKFPNSYSGDSILSRDSMFV